VINFPFEAKFKVNISGNNNSNKKMQNVILIQF